MTTKLNGKRLSRQLRLGDRDVIVTMTTEALEFRLPNKKTRAVAPWEQVLDMWVQCGNVPRPIRGFLRVRGRGPEIVQGEDPEVEIKRLKKALAKVGKQAVAAEKKLKHAQYHLRNCRMKIRRAKKVLGKGLTR